jgi:regulator of sigma E protease
MDILIQAGQFLLSLSLLIVLHEFGHFLPARLFNTRVEKFYLFFDYKWSLFKKQIGDTEWGIGWIPLGGYVKIAGMIDESMDKEQMAKPAEPWEFRSKPAWQRLIIMLGGVTVNMILGVIIYSMILFSYGEQILPNKEVKDGVWVMNPLAEQIGFQNGDRIETVRGEEVPLFSSLTEEIIYGGEVIVDRQGKKVAIQIPEAVVGALADKDNKGFFFYPRIPFVIGMVSDSSANIAKLQKLDKIKSIGDDQVLYYDQAKAILAKYKGQEVPVRIERDDQAITLQLKVNDKGMLGVSPMLISMDELRLTGLYKFDIREYSFLESWPAGWNKTMNKLSGYVRQFSLILNPSTGAYKSLGGFLSIGSLFPPTWNWEVFWNMTALLSIILAFMNLLPIPALDGGHVMFLLYEMITRREPNQKVLEYAQVGGFFILIALLLYANGNDIIRHFF